MKRILACIIAFGLVFAGFSAPVAGSSLVHPTKLGDIDFNTYMYNANDIDILLNGSGNCICPKYELYIHWWTNMCSLALGKDTSVEPKGGSEGLPEEQYSVVIGPQSRSKGYANFVGGHMALSDCDRNVAIGKSPRASGLSSVAIGDYSLTETNTWSSIAIGCGAQAKNSNMERYRGGASKPIAIGLYSTVHDGTAVGHHTYVTNGMYSLALGGGARVYATDAIQIGYGVNDDPFTAKIGNAYFVDMQQIANDHLNDVRTASGWAMLQSAMVSFMEDIASNRYKLPLPDASSYLSDQPSATTLGLEQREIDVSTGDDIGISQILNVIFGLIVAVLGFFGIKAKATKKKEETPAEEPVVEVKQVEAKPSTNKTKKTTKKTTKKITKNTVKKTVKRGKPTKKSK